MTFTKNLNERMAARRWKSVHLAAALMDCGCEVSTTAIDRWMDGSRNPNSRYIEHIATALECTPNDLLLSNEPAEAAQ